MLVEAGLVVSTGSWRIIHEEAMQSAINSTPLALRRSDYQP